MQLQSTQCLNSIKNGILVVAEYMVYHLIQYLKSHHLFKLMIITGKTGNGNGNRVHQCRSRVISVTGCISDQLILKFDRKTSHIQSASDTSKNRIPFSKLY